MASSLKSETLHYRISKDTKDKLYRLMVHLSKSNEADAARETINIAYALHEKKMKPAIRELTAPKKPYTKKA